MKKKQNRNGKDKGISLLVSIILVFCVLALIVFSVAWKTSKEMAASAIQNLSESLNLIECTIEAIFRNEADLQKMIARKVAEAEDPEEYVSLYEQSQSMVKLSLIMRGETEGISNIGEKFTEEGLDFSAGGKMEELPISQSYVNHMGTWAYTMKCPVIKEGKEIADLYIEYVYDSLDKSLPNSFYNNKAMLYIMDSQSERFVLKPKGMGERSAGHLNLEDYYHANDIKEQELRNNVEDCLKSGKNILFYHDIRGKRSLNYMWAVNEGTVYLIGYVPLEAIQQESRTVRHNIFVVVAVMLAAFFLCCLLYFLNQQKQNKIREEREREREKHNKQLADALQAAQLASNSKTMFLSNMSHDIRTPMNAVLGFAALLNVEADNSAKVREYTKKIMASGKHLLSLINDVLDVSKIESGKVALSLENFTLNDLVSSVDAIIRPMADNKSQDFHVEVTGIKHENLLGDETRINQILINLLSNAVKYTPEGGNIWFRIIGMRQRSSQFEHIRIEVEDDGYGMTPEYLKTIFDAFTRAENSTTNKVQGTGLGMAITKNIVELMGGTIDVSSEIDKGSLFVVELELRIPEEQADRKFWQENGIRRILVIDSEQTECESIQTLMKDMDVLIDTVSSVDEAVNTMQQDREGYQLVLLEWEKQGDDTVSKVNTIREFVEDTTLILFLAPYVAAGMETALGMEYTGILTKPFFVSALKEKILEIQGGRKEQAIPEEDAYSLEGLHFLAAEDNDINAEILSEILSMEGASCEIAANGRLALERFEQAAEGEFDAILMDVQMPVMNGYDVTRAIRALKRDDAVEIPIIAMTANAFAEDEKDALDAGMDVHLAKPIDVELLKKVISQYVKRKE